MLREILEFAIGPDDKHLLFLWARRLCKKSISMIEHPNFALLRISLTAKQSLTHVYVKCWNDIESIRSSIKVLESYRLILHVAENLLLHTIEILQDPESGASLVDVV